MIKIITLLWEPNNESFAFSKMYDELWVEKLYRGVKRNLDIPFEFICITDKEREWKEPIISEPFNTDKPNYAACIESFKFNEPSIIMGLDTVITGNITHLAEYCLNDENKMALPRDPFNPSQACNGVTLLPAGNKHIYETHTNENDMEWLRTFEHVFIDDMFPHQVKSYKGEVKRRGLGDLRIVYFHGKEKPHELTHLDWISDSWV